MEPLWRLFLFDGPRLHGSGELEVRRFRSQRAAALLAYLALRLGRDVPREELAEALWPEEDPKVTANRLRVTLTSLRHQIELPGMVPGSVLDASRGGYLRLRSETVWCDVTALDSALRRGDRVEAARLAQGTLLPGFWDEWILNERERFEALKEELPQTTGVASTPKPNQTANEATAELSAMPLRRLPLYLTSFVGREQELDTVLTRLTSDGVRLVTLTGLGGNGKTRLSVEVARRLPESWAVWFVPLSDLWQGERLADALRTSLGLTAGNDEPLEQLVGFLNQQKQPVLVLDNLEQIVLRAAPLLRELLTRVSTLRLVVTSRRRLEIAGETEVVLTPLEPPSSEVLAPELLLRNPALRLFLDRTREVRPDFTLTSGNTEPICALCRLLEGIPLGLELAAARMASLAPAQLHERLKQHWDALEAGEGRARKEDRHRSLRAVVEWSVALLPADARRLFVRLAHFAGGATLEAIEEVCEASFALGYPYSAAGKFAASIE
ncbi:MAG: winged helix-turn-helix domain-containing protein [Armatimonas sp.]